jgi:hypothetical protein
MESDRIEAAVGVLEAGLRSLDPNVVDRGHARRLLSLFARGERACSSAAALLARRVGDPTVLARESGTSVGRARAIVGLSQRLADTPALDEAVRNGKVSVDQATEIAKAETAAPGCAAALVQVAQDEPFHELRRQARDAVLADDRAGLAQRQHRARRASHRITDLGMIHIEADLEPHIGAPIVTRLETEAKKLATKAGSHEPFGAHLADALVSALTHSDDRKGAGKTGSRTDMVILVSHEITQRKWTHVQDGEHCEIPGVGPVDPKVAKDIARDAFLSGVFYDGTDLRHLHTWGRHIPAPVRIALRLGPPPHFDGPKCVDCGNRLRLEYDHQQPLSQGGPTTLRNLPTRCEPCHERKTAEDRKAMANGAPAVEPPDRDNPPPRDRGP